jgi:hypothetical protein
MFRLEWISLEYINCTLRGVQQIFSIHHLAWNVTDFYFKTVFATRFKLNSDVCGFEFGWEIFMVHLCRCETGTLLDLLLFKQDRQCMYKVVQIWPGRFVCKQVTVCPGHIRTTLYNATLRCFRVAMVAVETRWIVYMFVSDMTVNNVKILSVAKKNAFVVNFCR